MRIRVPFRGMFLLSVRGEITVQNVRVHDGDTIKVDVEGWPPVIGENIGIRILGIDCPELKDKRAAIRAWAYAGQAFLMSKVNGAKKITLSEIARDKYFRILAKVTIDGEDVATMMLQRRYARPYFGGTKDKWRISDVPG